MDTEIFAAYAGSCLFNSFLSTVMVKYEPPYPHFGEYLGPYLISLKPVRSLMYCIYQFVIQLIKYKLQYVRFRDGV